jgi:hypothetical protein
MTEDARGASLQEQATELAPIYELSVERHDWARWGPLLLSFLSTRLALVAFTATYAILTGQSALRIWNHWDARWYVGIATHGYNWSIAGKPAVAFFPLYPLLIHAGEWLGLHGLVAGMLISNVAFAGALFYVYRLVGEEKGEHVASRTVWCLALFPTAFFTFASYSESLYLLCAVAALYYARHGRYLLTAGWLAAVVLTRPTGALVIPAVLAALYLQRRDLRTHAAPDHPVARGELRLIASDTGRQSLREPITPSLLIQAGLVLLPALAGFCFYLAYLSAQRVPLGLLLVAQRSWHRSLTFPWTGMTSSINWLIHHGPHNFPWAFENVLEGAVTVLCLTLTVLAWKRMRWDMRLYCLGFWVLILTTPEWRDGYHAPFSSVDRFVLTLFPVFAWVAERTPDILLRRFAVIAIATMAAMTSTYLAGGWIG